MPGLATMTDSRSNWLTQGTLLLALAAILALAGYTYRAADHHSETSQRRQQTQEILGALAGLRENLGRVEHSLHDLVIDDQLTQRANYRSSVEAAHRDLNRLETLYAGNGLESAHLAQCASFLQALEETGEAILNAHQRDESDRAQTLLAARSHLQQSEDVRLQLVRMEHDQQSLLPSRDQEEASTSSRFKASLAALTMVVTAVLLTLYWAQLRRMIVARATREIQARFDLMADNACQDAIITFDRSGRVCSWNPGAEHLHDYRAGDILGKHLSRFYPSEAVRDGQPENLLEQASRDGQVRSEGWQLRKDGTRFWADSIMIALRDKNGLVHGFVEFARDVSERKQAEERLHAEFATHQRTAAELKSINEALVSRLAGRSEELETSNENLQAEMAQRVFVQKSLELSESRLRGVLESAMDAIITIDENERIVFFNGAAELMFECPGKDAIGAPLTWFIPARFRQHHSQHVSTFAHANTATRRMASQRIVTALRRSGTEFPIDASISQVDTAGGKLFTVILRDVTERMKAEQALQNSREELRNLAAIASSAREQEKARIARELHDEIAQNLAMLKVDLGWTLDRLPGEAGSLRARLEAMRAQVDSTILDTRRISADLRPLMLDDLGLLCAVQWLIDGFIQRSGTACELSVGIPEPDVGDPHATAIFRILQESLNNIAHHARASRVTVDIVQGTERITLSVRDNGVGFVTSHARRPQSFGLVGLRERVYLLNGEVRIESTPGAGTSIQVDLPL